MKTLIIERNLNFGFKSLANAILLKYPDNRCPDIASCEMVSKRLLPNNKLVLRRLLNHSVLRSNILARIDLNFSSIDTVVIDVKSKKICIHNNITLDEFNVEINEQCVYTPISHNETKLTQEIKISVNIPFISSQIEDCFVNEYSKGADRGIQILTSKAE